MIMVYTDNKFIVEIVNFQLSRAVVSRILQIQVDKWIIEFRFHDIQWNDALIVVFNNSIGK